MRRRAARNEPVSAVVSLDRLVRLLETRTLRVQHYGKASAFQATALHTQLISCLYKAAVYFLDMNVRYWPKAALSFVVLMAV